MGKISGDIRAVVIVSVCGIALSSGGTEPIDARMSGASQNSASGKPKPHSNHNPQNGGVFFMALDNNHHLEGVLLQSGVFKVYLYDAFTKPLSAAKVKQASGNVQVGESDRAPRVPLVVGKEGQTLEAALGKDLKLPVTITLTLRFQESKPNVRPEVFTFPFSHYIAADAHP